MTRHHGSPRRWTHGLARSHGNDAASDSVFGPDLASDNQYASLQRAVTRLRGEAIARPAPAPSAALAQRMDLGWVGERRHDMPAVLLPTPTRPRVVAPRVRYAIAAAVSAVVLAAGLAGAGALPPVLQDPIAHALHGVGIDLPTSGSSSPVHRVPRDGQSTHGNGSDGNLSGSGSGSDSGSGSGSTGSSKGPASDSKSLGTTVPTLTTVPSTVPAGGAVIVPPIVIEVPGLLPITLPAVTLPPITLPPITLPPITLPPITLPPITLPLITLPQL